ncbi:hypothetical protein [Cytobacillus kochii]|uniref:hypothetical protein n=1 Tax=Cytobacillus kochii TaxID=859143 RepID=UPI002040D86E|nr:hypothetical protein [Cytobacillus kochii]MCM3322972.1 hypothetical protein [Cytobacillus kochii]MCM3345368.1 hypothetical protein [Cytobacillus kochii]
MSKKIIPFLSVIVLLFLSMGVYQFYLSQKKLGFNEVVLVSEENLHSIIIATSETTETVSLNKADHDKQLKEIRSLLADIELKRYHRTTSKELYRIGFVTKTAGKSVSVYDEVIAIHYKNKKPTFYRVLNKEPLTQIIDILLSENK